MNAILQSQLDRIETALNSLSDSITSYNPSLPAAQELLDADAAFQKGIDQLTRHQRNYAYLVSLRAKADSLSQSLTSSLTLLASTRSEILSTSAPALPPLTTTGKPASGKQQQTSVSSSSTTRRPVPHAELLAVARNQARSAAPLNYLPPSAQAAASAAAAPPPPSSEPQTQASTQQLNPSSQPQTQTQTPQQQQQQTQTPQTQQTDTPMPDAPTTQQQQQQQGQGQGISFATEKSTSTNPGLLALPESELLWLDPLTQTPYLPWPSEDMIARSSLARVQGWAGAVVDEEGGVGGVGGDNAVAAQGPPGAGADVGGPGGQGGDGAGMEDVKREEGATALGQQQQPPPPPVAKEEKPKVFSSLDLFDPDEE